ncbi:MAG: M1 family aminopeptidase [Candidatus Zhuqueibacterota bacterium]
MKKYSVITFFVLLYSFMAKEIYCQSDYWQQQVDNTIYVQLFPSQKKISGHQLISYHNNSPDSLSEIYFHLYANAYTDTSIKSREIDSNFLIRDKSEEAHGWIKVYLVGMELGGQQVSIDCLKLLYDGTILKLSYSPAIPPGDSATISLKFESKIRRYSDNRGKGGYAGNQFEFCHWYPKVCVYDKHGWNAIPSHWLGEFYGEFGTFDVTINVPETFKVAATGELVHREMKLQNDTAIQIITQIQESDSARDDIHDDVPANSTRTLELTYHAENVHNFTWACNPDFLHETDTWNGIAIDVYYTEKSLASWKSKALADTKLSLKWLTENIGPYPYPKITVCEQIDNGGMEYPTIILINSPRTDLILHEIAHQYFYGAVANNELSDGWLDEGIVTYTTLKFLKQYPPESQSPPMHTNLDFFRKQFQPYNFPANTYMNSLYNYFYSGFERPLSYPCYELNNLYLYTFHVYAKPAKFFSVLEYTVGEEIFGNIVKEYYRRWQFKHVDATSLQSVSEQVSGQDLDWLFNQWLYSTAHVDYACKDYTYQKLEDDTWETKIIVSRLASGISPVEVEVTTTSGEKYRQRWPGFEKTNVFTFNTPTKVKKIQLDPDDKILDLNRLNNCNFTIKTFIYPDFYSMYMLPRDAYSLFLWPQLWYNDLDGVKLGLKVNGSYLNRYYVMRNQFWYNTRNRKLDYNLGFSMPWDSINDNLWRHIYVKNMEGRREVNLNINYNFTPRFNAAPERIYRFGFSHIKATDFDYTLRRYRVNGNDIAIQTWDKGRINQLYFDYTRTGINRPQLSHNVSIAFSHKHLGSDYNFAYLFYEDKYSSLRIKKSWQILIRNSAGFILNGDSDVPIQNQLWIGEGNPVDRFKYHYLRSPGSFPQAIQYYLPGDASLCGYANRLVQGKYPLTSDALIATNLELVYHTFDRFLPNPFRKHAGAIQLLLFFDAAYARVNHLDGKLLMDAGMRLQIHKQILEQNRTIRLNFPFWLSHPVLGDAAPYEPHWKFRWSISFQ